MSEGEPNPTSSALRYNQLKADSAFYERNTFSGEQVHNLLFEILFGNDLVDAHLEGIVALGDALKGTHPNMAIDIRRIPNGTIPRPLRERQKGKLAMIVADRIDMQVAHGVKQDAIIYEISQEMKISRREIFRMLKTARQERIVLKALEQQLADWDCWYEDYEIAEDGTLVPALRK